MIKMEGAEKQYWAFGIHRLSPRVPEKIQSPGSVITAVTSSQHSEMEPQGRHPCKGAKVDDMVKYKAAIRKSDPRLILPCRGSWYP